MRWPRGQRGQALPLVLIFLTVGMLMITPALTYVGTGLHSQRISERRLIEQGTIDSVFMDAIWRVLDPLEIEDVLHSEQMYATDEYFYNFELDLERWGVTIAIPEFGGSEWQRIMPEQEMFCKIDVEPRWLEAQGEETFYYIFRLDMPSWDMEDFSFVLPQDLTYDSESVVHRGPWPKHDLPVDEIDPVTNEEVEDYEEVDHVYSKVWMNIKASDGGHGWDWYNLEAGGWEEVTALPDPPDLNIWYLVIEEVLIEGQNRQKLTWKPGLDFRDFHGRATYIMVFEATGTLSWGFHYLLPLFDGGVYELEATAGIASAMYNIIIKDDAGEPIITAVIGITETGEVVLISYQVIG